MELIIMLTPSLTLHRNNLSPVHYDVYTMVIDTPYHLVMTNSSPWKDPPFFSSVNHLFLWAIYTMATYR